jgi:multidrug efflux pump subunit AcrA (membrane-fusion protein)
VPRRFHTGYAALAVFASAVAFAVFACSTKADLSAQGGPCAFASDCSPGLVCIAQKGGEKTCQSDLTGIQRTADPTPDAANDEDAAADGSTDAPIVANDARADVVTPKPAAGKVEKIVAAEGQAVNEGDVLLTLA